MNARVGGFSAYVQEAKRQGRLVVQPRMGFAQVAQMREGLAAVQAAAEPRIGTVTIDAYTRVGQIDKATAALREGLPLNGYPIVSHGPEATWEMLEGLRGPSFPVQVRHGSAFPQAIFVASAASGFDAIEGGPVSYNLPYSRAALAETVAAWSQAARFWADYGEHEAITAHIETFAGCMMGQLCPPGLLVALAVLEALFFREHGIRSVSLSLAQGIHDGQDIGALRALRRLAGHYLVGMDWHLVFYTFMGLFPKTREGAEAIIRASALIAVQGGAQRLIVKTAAEAFGVPTIAQNLEAMQWAREAADSACPSEEPEVEAWATQVSAEAECLIEATLALADNVGNGLLAAFAQGTLDVPYCPHPSNRNLSRATVDPATSRLDWASVGLMPIKGLAQATGETLDSHKFHNILNLNRRRYDHT